MAIQMRRGKYADFDPTKMLPGEWAVSLDEESGKQIVWMCFAPGVTKRMGTLEDFDVEIRDMFKPHLDSIKESETKAAVSETNAKQSENNAKVSETKAALSVVNASKSEANTKTSEANAFKAQEGAEAAYKNAQESANAANASKNNAKDYADKAAKSEYNAGLSASTAKAADTSATEHANAALTSEQNAKTSEQNTQTLAESIVNKIESGYFKGDKGDKGDPGENGITIPTAGLVSLSVDADGNLWAYTADETATSPFTYDVTTGNLYYVTEG